MRFFGNSQSLSIAMLQEIDQICDAFEAAWRRGERPVVKDYIPNWTGQERDVLLREILALDVDYRMRRGEMPDEQEYTSGIANSAHIVAELFRPIPKNRETVVENRPTRFDGGGPKDPAGRPSPPSGSSVDPNIGRVVGNFQIVSYLGGGGMGAVYRARHTMIQCERAVKVLQPALASHADAVRRFLREAQAAIDSLNHQNIVKAFDVGMDGKEVYLVMEVVDGEDLARTVGRSGPFPAEKAAELIEYAANGLAVAHAAGFVHRDIKPQNLMLTRDGVLKILDLGLIRLLEDPDEKEKTAEAAQSGSLAPMSIFASQLTDGRAILGTLAYMSPEQARSPGDADGRSDIYSLGCTLYFLLTGKNAFEGSSPYEILERHQLGTFMLPRLLRAEIPPSLERIVLKMMSLDPNDRYANAGQVARALRAWRLQESLGTELKFTEPLKYESVDELREILNRLKIISPEQWPDPDGIRFQRFAELSFTTGGRMDLQHADFVLEELQSDRIQAITTFQAGCIARGDADLLRTPRHVLRQRVGQGWKGEVFEAINVDGEGRPIEVVRTFAPEAMRGLPGDYSERLQVFLERCAQLAALQHPAFPRLLSFDTFATRVHPRLAYAAFERFFGQSANRFVQETSWSSANERVRWAVSTLRQTAEALSVAHRHGLLHLDLHDKSLMVGRAGEIRIVDLGIARWIIPAPVPMPAFRTGTIAVPSEIVSERFLKADAMMGGRGAADRMPDSSPFGTPEVMPPEQWVDRSNVSTAVDIYNLGCLFCFLATSRYPYDGKSVSEMLQAHLSVPAAKSETVKTLPRAVRTVVCKMLEKKPQERFQSMTDLLSAIDACGSKI